MKKSNCKYCDQKLTCGNKEKIQDVIQYHLLHECQKMDKKKLKFEGLI